MIATILDRLDRLLPGQPAGNWAARPEDPDLADVARSEPEIASPEPEEPESKSCPWRVGVPPHHPGEALTIARDAGRVLATVRLWADGEVQTPDPGAEVEAQRIAALTSATVDSCRELDSVREWVAHRDRLAAIKEAHAAAVADHERYDAEYERLLLTGEQSELEARFVAVNVARMRVDATKAALDHLIAEAGSVRQRAGFVLQSHGAGAQELARGLAVARMARRSDLLARLAAVAGPIVDELMVLDARADLTNLHIETVRTVSQELLGDLPDGATEPARPALPGPGGNAGSPPVRYGVQS